MQTKSKASQRNDLFSDRFSSQVQAWFFLILAIASEVVGLAVMKFTASHDLAGGTVLLYLMVAMSYFLLAKAVRTISLGVAYAVWEGSGIALITLISACVFQQVLAPCQILGLTMTIVGIGMVHLGETHESSIGKAASTIRADGVCES